MKARILLQIAVGLTLAIALLLVVHADKISAGDQQGQKVEEKFELYRKAIKGVFYCDIKDFRDSLKGGVADGKPVTQYDLKELLTGIKFEMQHTSDKFIALEIAADHLERIPDYYSRLRKLEAEAMSDRLSQM